MTTLSYIIGSVVLLLVLSGLGFLGGRWAVGQIQSALQEGLDQEVIIPEPDLTGVALAVANLQAAQDKEYKKLAAAIKATPTKTLNTIQGSVNNTTGKMGEMMQLIELQRIYDRLVVVGDIVDFIGIRFTGDEATVDFIDIKTGKKAVLNADQRKLRDLINKSPPPVAFKTVKVQIT